MHWLTIMAVAVCLRAVYSLGTKATTTQVRIHHSTLSTLLLVSSAGFALLLSPFVGGVDFSGLSDHWVKALVMVVSLGVGNVIYFKGQDMVDAGTTQIALATKLIWTALLAIPFLGASYSLLQIAGMGILAAAIVLVGRGVTSKVVSAGAVIIAISAISFSINSLSSADIASELSLVAYLLVSYLGAAVISIAAGTKYFREDMQYISKNLVPSLWHITLTGGISMVYFVAIYFAFREAGESRGLVAILTNAQVVTTVIAATIFLKERENFTRKFIAAILVIISSYLISGI